MSDPSGAQIRRWNSVPNITFHYIRTEERMDTDAGRFRSTTIVSRRRIRPDDFRRCRSGFFHSGESAKNIRSSNKSSARSEDGNGVWDLATHREDVPPEEMKRRGEEFAKKLKGGKS